MTDQPSNQDIMDAIQGLATHVDIRFSEMVSKEDLRRSEAETRDFIDRRISDVEASFAPSPLLPRSLQ